MKKLVCIVCHQELEEGFMGNLGFNWRKGKPLGRKLSEIISFGTSVIAFRCPTCGLIQQYTRDKVEEES